MKTGDEVYLKVNVRIYLSLAQLWVKVGTLGKLDAYFPGSKTWRVTVAMTPMIDIDIEIKETDLTLAR